MRRRTFALPQVGHLFTGGAVIGWKNSNVAPQASHL
jgi:hypothetical protein